MSHAVPRYRQHSNGQAVCQHKGHRYYLGKYDSDISKRRYQQLLTRLNVGDASIKEPKSGHEWTVAELIELYDTHAERYYSKNGKPTKEYTNMVAALRHLDAMYGESFAVEFGPSSLESLQEWLIEFDLCRGVINNRIARIKRFWRWCSRKGYVKPELYHGLRCVAGLQKGRMDVREAEPIAPVDLAWVDLTTPHLTPVVAAMVRTQLYCAMRPAEVCLMRPCDIDTSGDIWLFTCEQHKNAWRGQNRVVAIPRIAQAILAPYLDREHDAYLFSPQESEDWRHAHRAIVNKPNRKTPIYPSELKARERLKAERRAAASGKRKGSQYTTDSYRRAIDYGIKKANKAGAEIPEWSPNQLRHAMATFLSNNINEQSAQTYLGHARLETTAIYVERQKRKLKEIAREVDRRWAV